MKIKRQKKICQFFGSFFCLHFSKGIQRDNASVTVKVTPVLEIHPRAIRKHVGKFFSSFCSELVEKDALIRLNACLLVSGPRV